MNQNLTAYALKAIQSELSRRLMSMHFFIRQKLLLQKIVEWSLCFLHRVTYRTPCHPSGHLVTASSTDLREHGLFSEVFYLALLPAVFKASPGAGSSTSKLVGLHLDLGNIFPARLFV